MHVRVIQSTDHKFIGSVIPLPKPGDQVHYNEYIFDIVGVSDLGNSMYKIWSYNYIVICKVVTPTSEM